MSRLTRVIITTKRVLILCAIGFVILLLFSFLVYAITSGISNYIKYQNSLKAQEGFGLVPVVKFTSYITNTNKSAQFILDAPTSEETNYPKTINVYKLIQPQYTLDSFNIASDIVSSMGLNSPTLKNINPYTYEWITQNHNLIFNLENLSFNIGLNGSMDSYINYQNSNSNGSVFDFSSPSDASQSVYQFLQQLSYTNPNNVSEPLINVNSNYFSSVPITIANNTISLSNSTGSIPNAYYVFYREHVGGYKIYSYNPKKTLINFIIDETDLSSLSGVISGSFINYKIGPSSTYYVMPPSEAFKNIESGNGELVSVYPTLNGDPYNINRSQSYDISKFYVNNISLGYYETRNYSQYLIPIYIFSGTAYLSNNQTDTFYYYTNAIME